jgi:hypothetical protein
MAQFRGTVLGGKGGASRLGGKANGLTVTADGWHTGARVELSHEDGKDVVRVYRTGGSNGERGGAKVAEWKEE